MSLWKSSALRTSFSGMPTFASFNKAKPTLSKKPSRWAITKHWTERPSDEILHVGRESFEEEFGRTYQGSAGQRGKMRTELIEQVWKSAEVRAQLEAEESKGRFRFRFWSHHANQTASEKTLPSWVQLRREIDHFEPPQNERQPWLKHFKYCHWCCYFSCSQYHLL